MNLIKLIGTQTCSLARIRRQMNCSTVLKKCRLFLIQYLQIAVHIITHQLMSSDTVEQQCIN